MCIEITCYKKTGKFYTSTIYEQQQNVPLHKEEFKQVVKDALAGVWPATGAVTLSCGMWQTAMDFIITCLRQKKSTARLYLLGFFSSVADK